MPSFIRELLGDDKSTIKCHLFSLFYFGIIPIGLVCTHKGLESWGHKGLETWGHLCILPSLTSLSKCWCIISIWLWDDILLGVELRCCILLNPIQNPHLMTCNMYDTNCLLGCADSSKAHLPGLRRVGTYVSKAGASVAMGRHFQTPKDVIGTCRTH